jgi:hypothetical protein
VLDSIANFRNWLKQWRPSPFGGLQVIDVERQIGIPVENKHVNAK